MISFGWKNSYQGSLILDDIDDLTLHKQKQPYISCHIWSITQWIWISEGHLNKFWISRHKIEPILPHWDANVYWIPSNLSSIVVADSLTSFKKPDIQKSRFKQKIGFSTNELNLIIMAWVSLCYQMLDSLKFRIKPSEINSLHSV